MGEQSLIERLKAATEGSRQLDAEVFCAAHGHTLVGWSNDRMLGGFIYVRPSGARVFSSGEDHAAFTTSQDAATALALQVVPASPKADHNKSEIRLTICDTFANANIHPDTFASDEVWFGSARSPALALCIALLSALDGQKGSEAGDELAREGSVSGMNPKKSQQGGAEQ